MKWRGKTKGGVLGYKAFVFIIRLLGLKIAYLVLRFVALYYCFFSPKSSKCSYLYFRKVLQKSFLQSMWGVYQNYYSFGHTLIDKVAIIGGLDSRFSINHDGYDHLEQLANSETGAILISAHIGNYEMAGHLLKRVERPVNIVMYDVEHEKIKDYLSEVYGERPVNVIPIKNDLSHVFEISHALKRKEFVCLHGDRFIEGAKVCKIKFLGREALFPVGPFLLVHKLKVPFSFVFAVKEKTTHYHFFASRPKTSQGTIEDLMKEYIDALEEMVKKYPKQWYNFYDFWNFNDSVSSPSVVQKK